VANRRALGFHRPLSRFAAGILAALVLAALLIARTPGHASAFVIWCWDDPVVEINGQQYAIQNGIFADPTAVNREVQVAQVTVYVPTGSAYRTISVSHTYFNETVRFVEDPGLKNKARVETVYVAQADYPAALQLDGRPLDQGSTQGGALSGAFALK
jgi:hypothetical protein